MAEPGETFGIRIDHEPQDDEWPENASYRGEKEGREYQQGYRRCGKSPGLLHPDESFGYRAIRGSGVSSIYGGIDDAVQGHAGGAGADHGDRYPEQVREAEGYGRGKHTGVSKGQGEDGVLPFDHL